MATTETDRFRIRVLPETAQKISAQQRPGESFSAAIERLVLTALEVRSGHDSAA